MAAKDAVTPREKSLMMVVGRRRRGGEINDRRTEDDDHSRAGSWELRAMPALTVFDKISSEGETKEGWKMCDAKSNRMYGSNVTSD